MTLSSVHYFAQLDKQCGVIIAGDKLTLAALSAWHIT